MIPSLVPSPPTPMKSRRPAAHSRRAISVPSPARVVMATSTASPWLFKVSSAAGKRWPQRPPPAAFLLRSSSSVPLTALPTVSLRKGLRSLTVSMVQAS